jgi:hypothetical protein
MTAHRIVSGHERQGGEERVSAMSPAISIYA